MGHPQLLWAPCSTVPASSDLQLKRVKQALLHELEENRPCVGVKKQQYGTNIWGTSRGEFVLAITSCDMSVC